LKIYCIEVVTALPMSLYL